MKTCICTHTSNDHGNGDSECEKCGCPLFRDRREIQEAMTIYRAFQNNTNPHVLPKDVKALIADSVLARVEREAITSDMVEARSMHVLIKWLVEHVEECHHAELDRGPDHSNLLITTLDDVQQWLEDMSGVLGAEGKYALDTDVALELLARGRLNELKALLEGSISPEEFEF